MTSRQKTTPPAYSAPIVSKAMRVLRMVLTSTNNPGISDIASKLNLAKSTTHGILAALEESGWVLRDPITRKYTCGYAVQKIAGTASVRLPLVNFARPYLEKLSKQLDEDVFLGMCTGRHILVIDQVESSKELKISAKPGTRLSLYAGAVGKIFLAFHDNETITNIMKSNPLPWFTPKTITDQQEYLAELERVRQRGIALDVEEYIPNVRAVAAPVFHGKKNRRRMVAGFWLVGLDWHLTPGRMENTERLAREAGEALSQALSTQCCCSFNQA